MSPLSADYKIDHCHDSWWKYGAYVRRSFMGFTWWSCIRKTDHLETAQAAIRTAMVLPLYYRHGDTL